MKKNHLLLTIALVCFVATAWSKNEQSLHSLQNEKRYLTEAVDFHLTSKTPLNNAMVHLNHTDAWLFFDNIRPSVVLSTYASSIRINGLSLVNNGNARVTVYKQGTVVIPYSNTFKPLTVYDAPHFEGQSTQYGTGLFTTLGSFNNSIRSFRLKRGFMATLANEASGRGYSRVFVAQDDDLVFDVAPKELYGRVSFIRVIPWNYVSKKGWCTTAGNYDWEAGMTESTWSYSWSADKTSTNNLEYVPIRQHLYWPGWDQINNIQKTTAVLGYNEPEHSEQHDEGAYSVATAISHTPEFMNSGFRVGSPSPTDRNWIASYISSNDAANYRCDFVAMHAYWGGMNAQTWYNTLKGWYDVTKRPLWITEWNNGANWTTESWPSTTEAQRAKQLADLKAILYVLDTTSFVERYAVYNWVEDKRAILLNGSLTPAGEYYKNNHPDLAYNPVVQVIPKTPSITTPTLAKSYNTATGELTFTISDPNGELTDRYTLQIMGEDGLYREAVVLPKRAYDLGSTTYTYTYTPTADERASAVYRLKYEYLNGSTLYTNGLSFSGILPADYQSNDLPDGDFYFLHASNDLFLTNTGASTPVFSARKDTATQIWMLKKDTTGRYSIHSKQDSAFLTETAALSKGTYFSNWNSYELLRKNNSDLFAIGNGGKAGTTFWTVSGTTVTGKGSSGIAGFPFRLMPVEGAGFLPVITSTSATWLRKATVPVGDTVVLSPDSFRKGGSWRWNTGDTTQSLKLENIRTGGDYWATHILGTDTCTRQFHLEASSQNDLADGFFHILNPVDSTCLTNIGTLVPTFLPFDSATAEAQTWNIRKDPVTGRYGLYSLSNGYRFINEYGRFNTGTYSSAWNSYTLHHLAGTDRYAIQNGGSAGTSYWTVTSNIPTGKGSLTLDNFAFCLKPASMPLTVQARINGKYTDSLAVTAGTSVELQPQSARDGLTWKWDDGITTQNRSVTQSGVYTVTASLNGDTVTRRFKVEFYKPATLTSTAYQIRNPRDGSYLTYDGSSFPVFLGKDDSNLDAQTWIIARDATTGRYKITSKANPAFFIDEFGRYNGATYYPTWNSCTILRQEGTNLYAIQNGGSAGTHFWKIINSTIRAKGDVSLTGFPFELLDPTALAERDGMSAAMRLNNGFYQSTDSILTEAGTSVTLKLFTGKTGGSFRWETGETTDSLVLGEVTGSGLYKVTWTLGEEIREQTFRVNVYEKNQLTNGLYYLINPDADKYLSYVGVSIKPTFAPFNSNMEMAQGWDITKDPTTNRYRLTPLNNANTFINATGTFSTSAYASASNSFEIWQLMGMDRWAIRNGGTSGTAFWTPGTNYLNTTGSSTVTFPFRIKPYTGPTTGLKEFDEAGLAYGPNPFNRNFWIFLPEAAELSILTLDGRCLYRTSCQAGRNEIKSEMLPAGSYLGLIQTGKQTKTIRLIKTE